MGRTANGADAGSRHVTARATSTFVLAGSENHPDRHSMGKMGDGGLDLSIVALIRSVTL
jgi:hypothetical protein